MDTYTYMEIIITNAFTIIVCRPKANDENTRTSKTQQSYIRTLRSEKKYLEEMSDKPRKNEIRNPTVWPRFENAQAHKVNWSERAVTQALKENYTTLPYSSIFRIIKYGFIQTFDI